MEEDDGTKIPLNIVKIGALLLIGVVILNGIDIVGNHTQNTVTMLFTGNPSDGETVTLDSHMFEFDSGDGVVAGHIQVLIGGTSTETSDNLRAAIQTYMNI